MRKLSRIQIIAGAVTLTASVSGLRGASLLVDNFDSYADTSAFTTAWPVVGSQPTGTISTVQAVSLSQSVRIEAPTAGGTPTAQRNQRIFTESGNPAADNLITFSFDFYDSDASINPYRQHANLQDSASPSLYGQLVSMGLNNNLISTADGGNFYMARVLGHNGGAYFKLNDPGAPLRSTGWHNLRVEISDLAFNFYVDNILSEVVPQGGGAGTLRSYDVVRVGSGVSSAAIAFYDNVSVTTIPEPSLLALGLAGLTGVLRRRRVSGI